MSLYLSRIRLTGSSGTTLLGDFLLQLQLSSPRRSTHRNKWLMIPTTGPINRSSAATQWWKYLPMAASCAVYDDAGASKSSLKKASALSDSLR